MSVTTKTTLPKEIFSVEVPNHELLKLAYDAFLANARLSSASTKTRGDVRGGGKKPWKQKGTGRARFGSSRNPIWRGGGIAFGPTGSENYSKRLTTAQKRIAIKQALTLAAKANKIKTLDVKMSGKTVDAVKFIAENKLDRNIILVVEDKTPEIMRSTNNVQNLLVVKPKYLSVYYILNADHIVITPASLAIVKEWLKGAK